MDWKITATTVYCVSVGSEVTIIVSKDRSVKCTGCKKPAAAGKPSDASQNSDCGGVECTLVTSYLAKVFNE